MRPLGPPEWLALVLAVAIATGGLHLVFAPGFMSFDSLLFYEQAVSGITRSTWPPIYSYMIQAVRAAGGDYGALFLIQNAVVFFFGGYLALALAHGSRPRRLLVLALFFLAFLAVPALLGTAITLWNVTPVAGLFLAGAALQLWGLQGRRLLAAMAAAVAYAACFALRYDSIFLVVPTLLVLLALPLGTASGTRSRLAVAVMVAVAFSAAWLSFSYRLPDFQRLPFNAGVRTLQTFDIVGISARCGEDFLTPEMTRQGPVSMADIRAHYDPRHLNLTMAPKPGLATIAKPFDAVQVDAAWRAAVRAHPGCYLAHRWAVFGEQMGLNPKGLFYPTHSGIDANRFGFELAHPERAMPASRAIASLADSPLTRPAWLYLGALVAVTVLGVRRDPRTATLAVLTLAALAYAGCHLFVAAAADARYIYASNLVCLVVIVAALGGCRRDEMAGEPAP